MTEQMIEQVNIHIFLLEKHLKKKAVGKFSLIDSI